MRISFKLNSWLKMVLNPLITVTDSSRQIASFYSESQQEPHSLPVFLLKIQLQSELSHCVSSDCFLFFFFTFLKTGQRSATKLSVSKNMTCLFCFWLLLCDSHGAALSPKFTPTDQINEAVVSHFLNLFSSPDKSMKSYI